MPSSIDSPDTFYAPWEKTFGRILTPFEEFIHRQTAGGIVLIACTITALIVANSPLVEAYEHVLHTHIALTTAGRTLLDYSLHHWINDGLMALFFFVVGLEIKREVVAGDLADPRAAALPIIAAIGGMVVPAFIYALINAGGAGVRGWGVPMATDIAFAVGVLALLGNRVPKSLFTFLVALAIVDDLGAVVVIAIFYTERIVFDALGLAGVFLGILVIFNLAGVRNAIPYFLVGTLMWLAMLESGIHATLAGILTAWAVPSRPKLQPQNFSAHVRRLMDRFDELDAGHTSLIHNQHQRAIVQGVESGIHKVESPLQRLEHEMHMTVAFFVIPVFALANAGIPIAFQELGYVFAQPVALGVVLGLVFGKLIGIAGLSMLAIKLGWGQLPAGCRMVHLVGVGLVGGIGFTMSIFIAELGFRGQPELLLSAKTGILLASLVAGVGGYLFLFLFGSKTHDH